MDEVNATQTSYPLWTKELKPLWTEIRPPLVAKMDEEHNLAHRLKAELIEQVGGEDSNVLMTTSNARGS